MNEGNEYIRVDCKSKKLCVYCMLYSCFPVLFVFIIQFHERCLALKSPKIMNGICTDVIKRILLLKWVDCLGQYAAVMHVGSFSMSNSIAMFSMNFVLNGTRYLCCIELRIAIATPPRAWYRRSFQSIMKLFNSNVAWGMFRREKWCQFSLSLRKIQVVVVLIKLKCLGHSIIIYVDI